ncbi:hypothetical protein AOC05_17995 [Arthrobacter alpinus]|uniref:Uncharacterized protein n=1 Tax=Arthrobacter alpinus TaxID=656366 RepID=A0A0M4QIK7_9MICC|nr:hypothetical protein [Arthrobacter alpinus]ALE93780.1 hypothetical protein AOC05_17995 [Arthrobacter alpinus]
MKIERARLSETPVLAWTAAQALAAESGKDGIRRRAQGQYLMHLYSLALLVCGGRLWHWENKTIIAIQHKKPPTRWRWLAPAGLCAIAGIALSAWISNAATIRHWRSSLPEREAYKVSYLAMYPQTRQGLAFAKAAIEHVAPAGASLYAETRSESHQAIYARRGLHLLPTADGTPILAMGTR